MAEFVLGTVQLGLEYGLANRTGKPNQDAAVALLRHAVALGVRAFDTAAAYGDSEIRLGLALAGLPVHVVTKLSPLSELGDNSAPGKVVAAVEASVAQSLRALNTDCLDCVLLHRAQHLHQYDGAVWRRLNDYVAAGVIAKLGVSVQSPAEVIAALADPAVRHIQMPFNLLDWRWREAGILESLAARPDVVVHVRSVFLQGLLAAGDPALWPAIAGVDAAAVLRELSALTAELGRESLADLCLAYARGQNVIAGVVIGLETDAQLQKNVALAQRPPLTPEECHIIECRLPRLPEQLLNPALWPKP